jgi:probable phosphoglycerate mutase
MLQDHMFYYCFCEKDGQRIVEHTASDQNLHQVTKAQARFSLPAGARQVVLVRHGSSTGRTVETVDLGPLTISNPPLTEDGHAQAEAVGLALAESDVAAVFVTPLQRTAQTAAPLLRHRAMEAIVVEDLREVHLGDFEHTFYDHAEARHPAILRMVTDESWEAIPNAEQGPDFAARVRRGMDELLAALAPGETAALFTHAGTIGEICRQATGSRAFAFMGVENASISRLVILADGTWKLRTFNEVAHL